MNRTPDHPRDGVDVRRRNAADEASPRVDETQSGRQEATAEQPRLDATTQLSRASQIAGEQDDLSAAELDEAWERLGAALSAADQDFDRAAAYARLSRALPQDLVAIALVERAAVRKTADARHEARNFAWGLAAMLTLCAGLGALAFFGPRLEGRRERSQESAALDAERLDKQRREAPRADVPRTGTTTSDASLSPSETWEDGAWDDRFAAALSEFDAERRRVARPARRADDVDFAARKLEHNFVRLRHDFERQPGF